MVQEYREKMEMRLRDTCNDIPFLLGKFLIPSASQAESKVFYLKIKGDYYRSLAKVVAGDNKRGIVDQSWQAYQEALKSAKSKHNQHILSDWISPLTSVFYYEILKSPEKIGSRAKTAFDGAIAELDTLSEGSHKDSTLLTQLLRDNLTLGTLDIQRDEAEPDEEENCPAFQLLSASL